MSAANLRNADLAFTNFDRAVLCDADFSGANLFAAIFGDNDLSLTKGLDSVTHTGPSTVGVNTLYRSAGNLTEDFLRGCGLSDVDIEYAKLAKPGLTNEELEKDLKSDVICPIALDASWKDCRWPARLREQIMDYNILDFSNWHDNDFFSRQFDKLIEGLQIFYRDEKPKE